MTYSFSTFRSGKFSPNMELTDPNWWAIALEPRDQVPGGAKVDPTGFKGIGAVEVTATGAAAASATTIPISVPTTTDNLQLVLIPSGSTITFGGAKFATLTAPLRYGETSLTVAPLAVAIAASDKATFIGLGGIIAPSGTLVGRTAADMASNAPFKLATAANIASLTECYLLAFDSPDLTESNDITLTAHGFMIKQNRLPNWATLDAAIQTKIQALYNCTIGV